MAFIEPCFGIGHNLSLICQMTSEDIKHQLIIIIIMTSLWRVTTLSARCGHLSSIKTNEAVCYIVHMEKVLFLDCNVNFTEYLSSACSLNQGMPCERRDRQTDREKEKVQPNTLRTSILIVLFRDCGVSPNEMK